MIFILDNFDSFTFNLYQYFGEIGEEVIVRRRDKCTLDEIQSLDPDLLVISPGPCAPKDAGITLGAIDRFRGRIPILGVCLGHQAIGEVFGANVIRAKRPVHGKLSRISHDGKGVFKDLPNPLAVTRYHSLALDKTSIPDELIVTAETEDGEIMGIRHRELPIEGVQFHPEAIMTEAGHALLRNAVSNARHWKTRQQEQKSPWKTRKFFCSLPPVNLLGAFKIEDIPYLLDSGKGYGELGRYSFMSAFPFLQTTSYHDRVELVWEDSTLSETIWLEDGQNCLEVLDSINEKYHLDSSAPFPFAGGAVGFLSYDLKDEIEELECKAQNDLGLPLWRLSWYDGVLVYDHKLEEYTLVACGMTKEGTCIPASADSRINRLERTINNFLSSSSKGINLGIKKQPDKTSKEKIIYSVTRDRYLSDLKKVIDYIYSGDIYQANLTQRFSLPYLGDPGELYTLLHNINPAPFAAYIPYDDFQILCSSPERFIRIRPGGLIETCPIKGTRPRGKSEEEDLILANELVTSDKDRAELTMIIDLERNDLGRICQYGSVKVHDLIRLEKYPTVWHLVSTITGQLRSAIRASDILKALFPGGSITGAPKIRAMEVIEELEPFKRGIYTGCIGYFGFDGGWDLNIVIRTILLKDNIAYFHGGGGIVADSIPENEYEEIIHKVKALIGVLQGELDHEDA